MSKSESNTTTNHDEIKEWAEKRGAKPACVKGTGNKEDVGLIRLDFSGQKSLEDIEWDEWFEKFDQSKLALVYQETTASGEQSNFNKLVSRDTVEHSDKAGHSGSHSDSHHEPEHGQKARHPSHSTHK